VIAVIRSEWLKLRTTAVPWVLTGIALVINALLLLVIFLTRPDFSAPGTGYTVPHTTQQLRNLVGAGFQGYLFALLLGLLPVAARLSGDKPLLMFDSFYRAGSLVFGGGHVVLPLLRSEVVPRGWIGDDAFLAGYGAAQALPGPLFTFAAYLGTLIQSGAHPWAGGLIALFAIFLPGWLLVGGALPFWNLLRGKSWAQSALGGANAAVVGLLLAALYRPLFTESVRDIRDAGLAAAGLVLLAIFRAPPWAVVALMAAAGQLILR